MPLGPMQHREDSAQTAPNATAPLAQLLDHATTRLRQAGLDHPRREARLLAAHLLGASASALLDPATPVPRASYAALVARRAAHEPLAFITGRRGFWSLDLAVTPDTLIPRADTESLIEAAIAAFPQRHQVRHILDLGTGTGCLLLAALQEFPHAHGIGVDLRPQAAALASANARANAMPTRAAFAAGNWADCLAGAFDLILCNPPYIESAALAGLMPEIALHEPPSALDGGPSGLDAYACILPQLPRLLNPGGIAILELGAGQGPAVRALAAQAGLTHLNTRPDLAGIDRALVLGP